MADDTKKIEVSEDERLRVLEEQFKRALEDETPDSLYGGEKYSEIQRNFHERDLILREQLRRALDDDSHGGRYSGVGRIIDKRVSKDGVEYYVTSDDTAIGFHDATPELLEHFDEFAKAKVANDELSEEIRAFADKKYEYDKAKDSNLSTQKAEDVKQKTEDTKGPNFNERLRVLSEQFDSALKDESHSGRYNGVQKISDETFNKNGVDYYVVSVGNSISEREATPELEEHFAELAKVKAAQDKISEEIKAFYDKKAENNKAISKVLTKGEEVLKTDGLDLSTQKVEDTINVSRNSSININANYSSGSSKKIEDNMTVTHSQDIINTRYSSGNFNANYDKSGNGSHKTLQSSTSSPRKSLFDGMDIKGVSGSYKRMVNTVSVDADSPFTKNEQELASKKTEVREKTQGLYEDFKELLPSQTAINKATGDFCAKLKQHYEEANPDYTVNFGKKTSVETGIVDYYSEFRPKNLPEGKTSGDVLRISTVNGITFNDKPIAMCLRDVNSEAAIKNINKHLDAAKAYVPDATEAVKERYEQMKAAIDKAKNNGDFGDDGGKGPNGPKGPGE